MSKERTQALDFLERLLSMKGDLGVSVEVMVRAIAIQAVIFERMNPNLWEIAIEDARNGMSQVFQETNN